MEIAGGWAGEWGDRKLTGGSEEGERGQGVAFPVNLLCLLTSALGVFPMFRIVNYPRKNRGH